MPAPRFPPWSTFCALSLLFLLVNAGTFNALGVVLPAMVGELGWSWTLAGAGFTVLGLTCGLSSFLPALLARRFGVRSVMAAGTALLTTGFAVLATARSGSAYLAAAGVLGLAFSLCGTVPGAFVLTSLFKRRSTVLGAYFTIGALGGFAGPLLFVAVHAATGGWRPFWAAFAAASCLVGGFAILAAPGARDAAFAGGESSEGSGAPDAGADRWTVRRALATWQFHVVVAGYTSCLLINTTTHGFAVAHLVERGVDPKAAAGMLSLEALVGAGVALVGGVAGERIAAKRLMTLALGASAVGMAGLAEARGWGLMAVYVLGVGTGFGLSFLAATMLLLDYFGKHPNLELFSIMSVISTSAAIGPALGGWARDRSGSFTLMFLICAALVGAMAVVAGLLRAPGEGLVEGGPRPRRGAKGLGRETGGPAPPDRARVFPRRV